MYWGLLLFPEERPERSKVRTADNSIFLDQEWFQSLKSVLAALRQACPGACLWPFSWRHFLKEFRRSALRLGVKALVPYQMRHSGASIDRASETRSLTEVMKRGRWSTLKSVARYERATRLAHTFHNYSVAQQNHARACELVFADAIQGRLAGALAPPCAHV